MRGRTRGWGAIVAPAIVLAMGATGGCSSCKKKQNDDLTKDEGKKKHGPPEVPMPADLAFELVIKDPDDLVKRGADATGHGKDVGADPYQKILELVPDEDSKKIMRAFDPHGAVSFVVTAKASALLDVDHWDKSTVQVAAAAHIKDRDLAKTALDAASKNNGTKSGPAKGFDGRLYELKDDLAVGLSGDVVIVGDGADALEKCGRYVVYLAEKGNDLPHDMTMRVPLDALEEAVGKTVPSAWAKEKATGDVPPPIVAEIDPLVGPLVTAFGEASDGTAWIDLKGDTLVADQSVSAKGTLSKVLAAWPSGDASAMLAMPMADSVALYRWADGLGPLLYASFDYVVDESVRKGDLTAPEAADIKKSYKAFGASLGHEGVYSSHMSGAGLGMFGGGGGSYEYFVRIELSDPSTAKKAIVDARTIIDAEAKKPPDVVKLAITPYKKFGAEGETIVVPGSAMGTYTPHADSTVAWAIRGSYLYVDGCLHCNAPMFDDALDPAASKTFGADATAKAKIGSMPSKDVIEAGYGDMGTYFKSIMTILGVTPSGSKPAWGWSAANGDGIHAHEEVPVSVIVDLVQLYTRSLGMFGGGYGGYPMPMGTPAVPPPPPPPVPGPKPPF
jgi:hypothetical protein